MIGSSLDGIDVIDSTIILGQKNIYKIHSYREFPLSEEIKKGVSLYKDLDSVGLSVLGEEIANQIGRYITEHYKGILKDVDLIGFHGITLVHLPAQNLSIQLGCGQTLASMTGKPVVANFREEDIEAGGEGTPMAPIVEKYFFPKTKYFLNLGGIANVSIHDSEDISAFDVCPFNQVLNYFSLKESMPFDRSGEMAKSGQINNYLLGRLSSITYFLRKPPKSLDNNWIKELFIPFIEQHNLSNQDTLATLILFFAQEIFNCVTAEKKATDMMVTGGGAKNTFFIECLKTLVKKKKVRIIVPEERIVDGKEALLIILAAVLRKEEKPNFVSSVTGATKSVSGGTIFNP